MTVVLLTLAGLWLFAAVPWALWESHRSAVRSTWSERPARLPPGRPADEVVVVHHVHHVEHTHTVRHVHEVRAAAQAYPVAPRVVEGAVVQTRELPQ